MEATNYVLFALFKSIHGHSKHLNHMSHWGLSSLSQAPVHLTTWYYLKSLHFLDQLLLFNHNLTSFFPAVNSSRPSGCRGEFEDGNLGGERGPKTQRLTCSALVWLCPSGLEGYVYDIRFHFYSYPSSSKMLLTFCYSS